MLKWSKFSPPKSGVPCPPQKIGMAMTCLARPPWHHSPPEKPWATGLPKGYCANPSGRSLATTPADPSGRRCLIFLDLFVGSTGGCSIVLPRWFWHWCNCGEKNKGWVMLQNLWLRFHPQEVMPFVPPRGPKRRSSQNKHPESQRSAQSPVRACPSPEGFANPKHLLLRKQLLFESNEHKKNRWNCGTYTV